MSRHLSSIAAAVAFVGLFAATSQPPSFFAATSASQQVAVTFDDQGGASGEVAIRVEGLQHAIDHYDIELRVVFGDEDLPRWVRLVRGEDWEPRLKHTPALSAERLVCEPAPEPCEATIDFELVGRRDRTLDVPIAVELGTMRWYDEEIPELEELIEGATVHFEVTLD